MSINEKAYRYAMQKYFKEDSATYNKLLNRAKRDFIAGATEQQNDILTIVAKVLRARLPETTSESILETIKKEL